MKEDIEEEAASTKIKVFPAKELDDDEKDTLTRLDLASLIIEKKKKTSSAKAGKKKTGKKK